MQLHLQEYLIDHLEFYGPIMGSLKSPWTFYTSSIETIALNCLVSRKSRFCIRILDARMKTSVAITANLAGTPLQGAAVTMMMLMR